MKYIPSCLVFCFCAIALSLSAQSVTGNWSSQFSDGNGGTAVVKVAILDNGTYEVDFANDGTVEVKGQYTLNGDQMTIWDVSEGPGACPADQKGVYKVSSEGNTLTMAVVSEACPGRGGPDGKIVWTRI